MDYSLFVKWIGRDLDAPPNQSEPQTSEVLSAEPITIETAKLSCPGFLIQTSFSTALISIIATKPNPHTSTALSPSR
ncbi:hypothetical protein DFR28_10926 [Arenicella xantha]|uniref:Uncharacterized protein n=1 Tax=Arenicella xantha TaxID=644221 RepID=A0A395JH86_9GAMM|nr:hypothetical protein DFR28_10926 [Arenicella xantha]